MTPLASKPTISELEANWNVHLAGLRAEKAARAQGITEKDSETLLDAAVGGKLVGGILFPPIHAGFMLMLDRVERLAREYPVLNHEMVNLGALAVILQKPEIAWPMLKGGHGELFLDTVTEFSAELTLDELRELTTWVKEQMAILNQSGDAVGKPLAE